MTIEPKWMSEDRLARLTKESKQSRRPMLSDLLAHIAALQSALDIEKRYREGDQAEARLTLETIKRDLEWERNEHQRSVDTLELVLGEAEATVVNQIAEWFDMVGYPEKASLVRAGLWRSK